MARNIVGSVCGDVEASWPDARAPTPHFDVLWQSLMVVAGVIGRVAGSFGKARRGRSVERGAKPLRSPRSSSDGNTMQS